MRVSLVVLLALALAWPAGAQQLEPAGHRDTIARADSGSRQAPSVRPLSFKRHFFIGVAVGVLAAGAGFYIEANTKGYGDCIGCEIVIPIAILASGAAGGIIGGVVYGLRRLEAKQRTRPAAVAPGT